MTKKKAIFEILLCSFLWSTAGIFMKQIPWSGFAVSGVRGVFAGGVIGVYMAARHIPLTFTRRSVTGGICLCATMTLFAVANKATTAGNAIVLQFTAPIWIMLISGLLLRARFRGTDVLAAALTVLGVALCFAGGLGAGSAAGDLIAVCSGVCLACYYLTLSDSGEPARMTSVLIGHVLSVAVGLPFLFAQGTPVSAHALFFAALLGVVQLGIPYVLLAHASGWCPPLACSLLTALEPLLNPLWVAIFDGETPGALAVLGAAVVIFTVTVWCVCDGRRSEAAA